MITALLNRVVNPCRPSGRAAPVTLGRLALKLTEC